MCHIALPQPLEQYLFRKLALVGIIPIKFSSLSAPTKIEELTAGSDEKTQRSPAGNRTQGLSSDPAVSSSIFVGAEREENLIVSFSNRAPLIWNSLPNELQEAGSVNCFKRLYLKLLSDPHSANALDLAINCPHY